MRDAEVGMDGGRENVNGGEHFKMDECHKSSLAISDGKRKQKRFS